MGAFKELYGQQNVQILFMGDVQCGFPSPATEYIESSLNLHEHVVKNPAATFFMRAVGDSMIDAGIYPGDILIVDRSIQAKTGHIVVASIDGEMTLKELSSQDGQVALLAANSKYKPILIRPGHDFQIFGVLTYNLHRHFA